MMEDSKICIIRNDKVGDVLLTCPMIHTIKDQFPTAHITVIVNELTYPLIKRVKAVDEAVIDYRQQFRVSYLMLIKKVVKELKEKQYDYIFFSYLDPLYVIASLLAGIQYRVGDANNLILSPLINKKVSISWHDFTKHEIEQQVRLLEPFITKPIAIGEPSFIIDDDLKKDVKRLLTEDAVENGYIVIHPGYGEGNRGWPAQQYAKLVDLIQTRTSYRVVITGANKEKDITDVIMQLSETEPINLVSKTTIDQLLGLISDSKCVIGAETGPTHMATLCKRPVISISPTKYTKSFRWGPFGTNHVVIKNNDSCDLICHTYKKDCQEDYCLKNIKLDHIFTAITFIIDQETFPKNQLYYWFKTSATVAILIEEIKEDFMVENEIRRMIDLLQQENIRWFLCTTKQSVKDHLSLHYDNIFMANHVNILKWVKQFSVADVTIIHALSKTKRVWIEVLKKLIALKLDREPVLIESNKSFTTIKELLDYYLQATKKLSITST
ncbi:hypothetical protein DID74_00600 [Candidatus Marinamargulisbacteria bacterium SCGC AG-333-B06]|nr:hypothetical protein DID74_00600 [Candidatus Marinamargulisbacteria bacterium SCGC AG-333-B06]